MKPLRVPEWWDSIRSTLAFLLSASYCAGVLWRKIPKEQLDGLYRLAELALIFYFVLKKRGAEEEFLPEDIASTTETKEQKPKEDKVQ